MDLEELFNHKQFRGNNNTASVLTKQAVVLANAALLDKATSFLSPGKQMPFSLIYLGLTYFRAVAAPVGDGDGYGGGG